MDPAQCEKYVGQADEYGYCVFSTSPAIRDAEAARSWCKKAGDWEERCLHSWVSARLRDRAQWSDETLLGMCRGIPDCAFEILDFRPHSDILVQLNRCGLFAEEYGQDCGRHSLQRWWKANPDAPEIARVMSTPSPFDQIVGSYAAASVYCLKVGSCEGLPDRQHYCEAGVAHLVDPPERCGQVLKGLADGGVGPATGPLRQSALR